MKKIAVIGLGSIANRHRRNLKNIFPDSIIYAISASGRIPDKEVINSDVVINSLEELIKLDIEMAIVASPATLHETHGVPLLEAGIPVLMEKPVAISMKEASHLLQIAKEYKTPIAVGYCLRYLPSASEIKKLLDKNLIGDIYNVFIEVGQYLPDWRPDKNYRDSVSANEHLGGGVLFELSHELDYANWLLGSMDVNFAILRSSKELGLEVEDIADVTLTTKNNTVCNIHLDFLQKSVSRTCSFVGSKGRLDWCLIENKITFSDKSCNKVLFSGANWDKNQLYINMLKDFVKMIQGRPHQCVTLKAATNTLGLIASIKEKAIWRC